MVLWHTTPVIKSKLVLDSSKIHPLSRELFCRLLKLTRMRILPLNLALGPWISLACTRGGLDDLCLELSRECRDCYICQCKDAQVVMVLQAIIQTAALDFWHDEATTACIVLVCYAFASIAQGGRLAKSNWLHAVFCIPRVSSNA